MPMEVCRAACHLDEPAILGVDAKGSPMRSTSHWQVQTLVQTWEESRANPRVTRPMEVFLIRVCVCPCVIREGVFFYLMRKTVY